MFLLRQTALRNKMSTGISTAVPQGNAIKFLENETAGSAIRLVWDSTNLLDRDDHTVIYKVKHFQQTGYYATFWHSQNNGSWDSGAWSYGTHPYPCLGNYEATSGACNDPIWSVSEVDANDGTEHWWEIAADGGDRISTPNFIGTPAALEVVKDTWLTQVRRCKTINGGTDLEEEFWPDWEGNPSFSIIWQRDVAGMGSPSTPAFYLGASDWRDGNPSAGRNDETPGGEVRFIKMFDVALSTTDIETEINEESNTAVSTAGLANTWYMNINPTHTDVTDKSGEGHNPSWANANRPTTTTVTL